MAYIARLDHFTFSKEADEIVITSERNSSFEQRHNWPEEWTMTDEDLQEKLYDRFYLDLKQIE